MINKSSSCYTQKEDIEAALRNNNMGLEETLNELGNRAVTGGGTGGDAWRNPPLEDHPPFDINNPNFPQRFPPAPHSLPFTSQVSCNFYGVLCWSSSYLVSSDGVVSCSYL